MSFPRRSTLAKRTGEAIPQINQKMRINNCDSSLPRNDKIHDFWVVRMRFYWKIVL